VVIALAALAAPGGFRGGATRAFRLMCYSVALLLPALFFLGGKQYIHGLTFTTLDRQAADGPVSAAVILTDSADWAGFSQAHRCRPGDSADRRRPATRAERRRPCHQLLRRLDGRASRRLGPR